MKNRTLRQLAAIFVMALLVGCGTSLPKNASTAEIAEKAVIVFSVSHDIENGDGVSTFFALDRFQLSTRVQVSSVQSVLSVPLSSDFKDRRGHLYVLEVSPGRHQFDDWHINSLRLKIFHSTPPEPLVFEVAKGDVLYLGNLHSVLSPGHRTLGGRTARAGHPTVVDRRDQDIPQAEERIPALKGRIRPALLPTGPWIKDFDNRYRIQPLVAPVMVGR